MKNIVSLFFLLMSGCGFVMNPTKHYGYYVSYDFSLDQTAMIYNAFTAWTNATDGMITFELRQVQEGPNLISVYPALKKDLGGKAGLCWWYPMTTSENIQMATDINDYNFRKMTLHEVGHALGLQHDEPGTMMCQSVGCEPNAITCKDIQQFCTIWGCNPNEMTICK